MGKRSARPKWIKGEGKVPVGEGTLRPMKFNRQRARKKVTRK